MPTALNIVQRFYPHVKTVVDTKKALKIKVTKRDCESKAVKDHKRCALAVACQRSLKLDGVIIAISSAYLVEGNKATRYGLGESIAREVTSFDRNGTFAPGEYLLLEPPHKLGDPRSSGSRKYKKGTGKAKGVYRHLTTDVRSVWESA